jgi:hypothetical protein
MWIYLAQDSTEQDALCEIWLVDLLSDHYCIVRLEKDPSPPSGWSKRISCINEPRMRADKGGKVLLVEELWLERPPLS